MEIISLDELVPAEHMVRKTEAVIDWNFIYGLVEEPALWHIPPSSNGSAVHQA